MKNKKKNNFSKVDYVLDNEQKRTLEGVSLAQYCHERGIRYLFTEEGEYPYLYVEFFPVGTGIDTTGKMRIYAVFSKKQYAYFGKVELLSWALKEIKQ